MNIFYDAVRIPLPTDTASYCKGTYGPWNTCLQHIVVELRGPYDEQIGESLMSSRNFTRLPAHLGLLDGPCDCRSQSDLLHWAHNAHVSYGRLNSTKSNGTMQTWYNASINVGLMEKGKNGKIVPSNKLKNLTILGQIVNLFLGKHSE